MNLSKCPKCGNEMDVNSDGVIEGIECYTSCMGAYCGYVGPKRSSIELAIQALKEVSAPETTIGAREISSACVELPAPSGHE